MEENPEILAKYQKLALEYSKLKAQISVLKTAVSEEQNTVSNLQDTQKKKDQLIRKLEQEVECLNFRNLQLSKRVSVLQTDLENVDSNSKHYKGKSANLQSGPLSESYAILNAELQSRIEENERLHQQVYAADLEHGKKISEMSSTTEQLQSNISELERKTSEKIKEQEILIDTLQKEKIKMQVCIKNHEQELKRLNSTEEIKTRDMTAENEELLLQLNEMKRIISDNILFNDKSKDTLNTLNVPIIQRGKHDQLSILMLNMQTLVYDFCRQLSDLHTFMIQRLCSPSPELSIKTITVKLEVCLRESIQQLKVIPLNFENITSAIKAETLTWDKSPVKNFCIAFQRYEKYLDKLLPFLILRIQSKESWTASSKMIELVPKLAASSKKLTSCIKKLHRYIYLLSCIGSSEKDVYYASQGAVIKKILSAIQYLHTLFDDARKLFGSKIALDQQLPMLNEAEKSTDECILSTLVSVSSTSKKIADLMEKNIDILSYDIWYKPKYIPRNGKVSPSVWKFKERGVKYLQQIAQGESPSIPYEVALKNYQTLLDHTDNQENLTQQLEEYQNKLMQLELDKENWMLECELMKVKGSQNSGPGSPEMKLQDYDEIHLFVKNTVNQLIKQIQFADSKAIAFKNECETLHQRLKMSLGRKQDLENEVLKTRKEVDRLKEEQKTLTQSYDEQLNTMSEHLANLNETLTAQKDEIDVLKHSGSNKGRKGKSK